MIYAVGLGADNTFIHFLKYATRRGVDIQPINLQAVVDNGDWRLSAPDDQCSFVSVAGERIPLDPFASYYCRIVNLSSEQCNDYDTALWNNLVYGLYAWLTMVPGKVINRPSGIHIHNSSKPLHESFLLSVGMKIPPRLTSSNPKELYEFSKVGKTVVKPISGGRANTRLVEPDEFVDFIPSRGPVHLQRFVQGNDVRAHVVGSKVHAELIVSDQVDYRKSVQNSGSKFIPHQLPSDLERKIISITSSMRLIFSGWDFKLNDEGYWCLEANPTPGYDSYDRRLSGRITDSLLEELSSDLAIIKTSEGREC